MGRPPSNGSPAFRFSQSEVVEMEAILQEHLNQMPTREVLEALAKKFSGSAERLGKVEVQMKQNRRYAVRAKTVKGPEKLGVTPMPRTDSTAVRSVPQTPQLMNSPSGRIKTIQRLRPVMFPSLLSFSINLKYVVVAGVLEYNYMQTFFFSLGRTVSDHTQMEFEAKSARDGAWYDVTMFISHRSLEMGDADVLVRFAGFGAEEDEWINVRKHVRQRSLPCESSECVAVLPGDLTLCFQEGKEQALYFDAHVLDAQRRRHDVRGCRCRFLVRYDHDQSEEIVPLRKVCRRPETDYRLQQLLVKNELGPANQHKPGADPPTSNSLRVYPPIEPRMQKQQQKAEGISDAVPVVVPPTKLGNVNVSNEAKVLPPKTTVVISSGDAETSVVVPPANVAVTSGAATSTLTSDSGLNIPQG
ncbi:hypothetical protein RHMOL_Rhmol04G0040100 [Rhododendron molle]|uniref:Uncharacterized protein n=1 Tax=Rhododendron molle TaxID=49168 RepID=A0ACC0NXY2_RHOML|nr:hypothetical protein RHMOL_Rhmol04G0040100 [Rhododendron molle]